MAYGAAMAEAHPKKSQRSPRPAVRAPARPSFRFERKAMKEGCTLIAGVDEAGRGPLAGTEPLPRLRGGEIGDVHFSTVEARPAPVHHRGLDISVSVNLS